MHFQKFGLKSEVPGTKKKKNLHNYCYPQPNIFQCENFWIYHFLIFPYNAIATLISNHHYDADSS